MTETAKTFVFVGAAALSLIVAFAMGPTDISENLDDLIGSRLNQFDVDVAKRLKIVKFNPDTATTREFEVAENDGLWTIPSKQDYPADAASQMGEAATCLIDREVLRVAAKSAAEHKELGVLAPNDAGSDTNAEGVGTRVTITDSNDATLTDMIIGKPVKDADGQYYVRNANQDVVYVVSLEPEKLSTKFDDWIEDDLLQLTAMDLQRVYLEDYSAEMQIVMTNRGIETRVMLDQRGKMELNYDTTDSKWKASQLQKFDIDAKDFVDDPLAEDEEIDEETMKELRDGLDDLLLVDVERKPEGLSSNLKASADFLNNREALESLQEKGFIPVGRDESGEAEILSSEGQTVCTLKNGVEYVLRFGNLQVDGEGGTAKKDEPADDNAEGESTEEESSDDGFNRYLFVMARFNESILKQPELAEVPELPEGVEMPADDSEESTEETEAGEKASDTDADTESVTEEAAEAEASEETEEQEEEEEASEQEETEAESSQQDSPEAEPSEEASTEADATTEATGDTEEAEATESTEESSEGEAAMEASPADEAAEDSAETTDDETAVADLIAERKAIEKENQRKLDEYQDQVKAGKEKVAQLNERFGDWYYVISNDVYKKIHLSRSDVVKKKESEADAEAPAPNGLPAGIPGLPNLPINPAN